MYSTNTEQYENMYKYKRIHKYKYRFKFIFCYQKCFHIDVCLRAWLPPLILQQPEGGADISEQTFLQTEQNIGNIGKHWCTARDRLERKHWCFCTDSRFGRRDSETMSLWWMLAIIAVPRAISIVMLRWSALMWLRQTIWHYRYLGLFLIRHYYNSYKIYIYKYIKHDSI